MAPRPGSNAESPTADDQVENDARDPAVEALLAERDTEHEPPAAEPTDAEPAEQADAEPAPVEDVQPEAPKAGAPVAKPEPEKRKPSPVDALIEDLSTPKVAPKPDTPAAKPADPAAAKPKDGEQAPEKPAAEAGQPNDDSNDDDPVPVDQWSPEERKHTKGRTKERYRKLYDRFEQQKPLAEVGAGWATFVQKHQLAADLDAIPDEGLTVAVRTQAAALRVAQNARAGKAVSDADVAYLERNRAAIDQVLGLAGRAPAPNAPDLSKVVVSQDVRDLTDALGVELDDDALRAVQVALDASKARKGGAAPKPAEQRQPAAKPAPAAPPRAAAPAPATPPVLWTDEDEVMAQEAMREDIVKAGVAPEKAAEHYELNLAPLVTARLKQLYPGRNPDEAWDRLSPTNRRELVSAAQSRWAASQKPPTPPTPPAPPRRAPAPPPVQGTGNRPALLRASANSGKGAVARTIDHLAGGESE